MPAEEPLTPHAISGRGSASATALRSLGGIAGAEFPRPIVIRRRRYWYLRDVERWERNARANKTRPGPLPPKAA